MINHDKEKTRARVAWIAAGVRGVSPALADAARLARFDLVEPPAASDIAVVDLYDSDPGGGGAAEAVASARRLGAGAGVLIAADAAATSEQRRRLARLGETVFLRTSVEPLIGAVRERLRLATLAEETGDRLKSLVADGRAVSFSTPARKEDGAVLIAGKPSPIALTVSHALGASSRSSVSVFTAGQAMRALDHGGFDGAVFIPADENDLLIALARALRRHREHRRLPVVIVSADEELLDRRAAKDGLDAMTAARAGDDLARRLETLTRRADMSASMRAFLRSPEGNGGGRGAANARLFAQHAMRVSANADDKGRSVSFVALAISPKAGTDPAAARGLLDEALRTAGRLVRAEDMIAKLTTTTFIVMLRGTRRDDADRVARRIEGVVTGVQPRATLDLWDVRASAVERAPGMEFERVIAALVADLRSRRETKSA